MERICSAGPSQAQKQTELLAPILCLLLFSLQARDAAAQQLQQLQQQLNELRTLNQDLSSQVAGARQYRASTIMDLKHQIAQEQQVKCIRGMGDDAL